MKDYIDALEYMSTTLLKITHPCALPLLEKEYGLEL
jgi:hypothetical protein